jgi:hypothetical protein
MQPLTIIRSAIFSFGHTIGSGNLLALLNALIYRGFY